MSRQPKILQAAIKAGCSNPPGRSRIHGSHHWKCVAEVGLYLMREIDDEIDRDFITTFAQLHDVMRRNDGIDYNHGLRAEILFRHLIDCGQLRSAGWNRHQRERVHAMAVALRCHCWPGITPAMYLRTPYVELVSICWDADRLCRYRLHERPDNRYLSTRQARSRAAHRYAADRCAQRRKPTWSGVLDNAVLSKTDVTSRVR